MADRSPTSDESDDSQVCETPSVSGEAQERRQLPQACEVLEADNGCLLYLIGTAHFSEQSCQDVRAVMRAVQPHQVLLELCQTRSGILTLDEESLRRQAADLSLATLQRNAKALGWSGAIMHYLLGRLSACIMQQIGLLPGAEFRTAVQEARSLPGCRVLLLDRPIRLTIQRTLGKLSIIGKVRLAYSLLFGVDTITKEQIEMFKDKDLLEQLLAELADSFPELQQVIVDERDRYMAYNFRRHCQELEPGLPSVTVGVVGLGHKSGIKRYWPIAHSAQVLGDSEKMPETPLLERSLLKVAKYATAGAVCYSAYRLAGLAYRRICCPAVAGLRALVTS